MYEGNENPDKIVDFEKYCKTCKHKAKKDAEGEEPCNFCLDNTTNVYSRKPIKYEPKDSEKE